MVIVVDGPAGSGKSSYMQMLLSLLQEAPDLAATAANAPSYNRQGHLLPAILNQLAREVEGPGLFELVVEFCTGYVAMRDSTKRISHCTQHPEGIKPTRQLVEANLAPAPHGQDAFLALESLQELYLNFLEALLGPIGQSTVALFVDDLDACDAGVVDGFLNDLFSFCAVPGSRIIWILGMDLKRMQEEMDAGHRPAQPLDKLINLRVQVPAAKSSKELVVHQLNQIGLGGKQSRNAQALLCRVLADCEVTNPRLIKRVTSRVGYARAFGAYPKTNELAESFVALALLYEAWPGIHRALLDDISLALHVFGNFANSAKTGKASAQTLLQALKGQQASCFEPYLDDRSMHLCLGKVAVIITSLYNLRGGAMDEVIVNLKTALRSVAEIF